MRLFADSALLSAPYLLATAVLRYVMTASMNKYVLVENSRWPSRVDGRNVQSAALAWAVAMSGCFLRLVEYWFDYICMHLLQLY